MLCLILVFFGTLILVYAELFYYQINLKLKEHTSEEPCLTLMILIGFFIFGYILFFTYLMINIASITPEDLLVSIVFFFGSIFVIIFLKTNNNLIFKLNEFSSKCKEENTILKQANKVEEVFASANYQSRRKYEKKCEELQEKIEELEKFQKLTVNRELKMIELKEKLQKYQCRK